MRKALTFILLLFCACVLHAQEADSVAAPQGKLIPMEGAFLEQLQERDSILIADQLLYGFRLSQVQEGTRFVFPEIPEEQDGKLRFLSPWILDTVKIDKQKKGLPRLLDLKGSVKITSFDEGVYELAPIMVLRVNTDGVADTLVFEPMSMEVKTMPVDTASFQPHDIKGQIRYPLTFAEVLPWLAGVCVFIALIFLVVYLVRRHRKNVEEAARKEPAHIVALRKLDQYRGNKLWAPEKQKIFYSGVTDTLREYIALRYEIPAMEMTTAEIFDEMKDTDVPSELMLAAKELFERADFVKFAKFTASDDDNASTLPLAVRFVTETYQAEIESEEAVAADAAAADKVEESVKEGGE